MKTVPCFILLSLLALPSVAQEASPVIYDVVLREVPLYDDDYNELGSIKANSLKNQFVSIEIGERNIEKGLPVLTHDEVSGMLQVNIDGKDQPVWIDETTVLFTNSAITSIKCPLVTSTIPNEYNNASSSGISDFAILCQQAGDQP